MGDWETWNTYQELKFIKGLGTFCEKTKTSRKELLKRYLIGAKLRDNWMNINKQAALAAVETELGAI